MDDDLRLMSPDQLIEEVKRLRAGIRRHRDSSGQELCWHHPQLWGLLPEKTDPLPKVPEWPEFLQGCLRYRQSLDQQLPSAPRTHEEFRPSQSQTRPAMTHTTKFTLVLLVLTVCTGLFGLCFSYFGLVMQAVTVFKVGLGLFGFGVAAGLFLFWHYSRSQTRLWQQHQPTPSSF